MPWNRQAQEMSNVERPPIPEGLSEKDRILSTQMRGLAEQIEFHRLTATKLAAQRRSIMAGLHAQGRSFREIGELAGLSATRVYNIINEVRTKIDIRGALVRITGKR